MNRLCLPITTYCSYRNYDFAVHVIMVVDNLMQFLYQVFLVQKF